MELITLQDYLWVVFFYMGPVMLYVVLRKGPTRRWLVVAVTIFIIALVVALATHAQAISSPYYYTAEKAEQTLLAAGLKKCGEAVVRKGQNPPVRFYAEAGPGESIECFFVIKREDPSSYLRVERVFEVLAFTEWRTAPTEEYNGRYLLRFKFSYGMELVRATNIDISPRMHALEWGYSVFAESARENWMKQFGLKGDPIVSPGLMFANSTYTARNDLFLIVVYKPVDGVFLRKGVYVEFYSDRVFVE